MLLRWGGEEWRRFRFHELGFSSTSGRDLVDLKTFESLTSSVWPFSVIWKAGRSSAVRRVLSQDEKLILLKGALSRLDKRAADGPPSFSDDALRLRVLEQLGQMSAALEWLNAMRVRHDKKEAELLFLEIGLLVRMERWDQVYETVRKYEAVLPFPALSVRVSLVNALMHLNAGSYALNMSRDSRSVLGEVTELVAEESGIWDVNGFHEEGLFQLEKTREGIHSAARADLLYKTGRIKAGRELALSLGASEELLPKKVRQRLLVAPPELVQMTGEETTKEKASTNRVERLKKASVASASPFFKQLALLELSFRTNPEGALALTPWEASGRDDREKGVALGHYAVLLTAHGRKDDALRAAKASLALDPEAVMIWRLRVALAAGDPRIDERHTNRQGWEGQHSFVLSYRLVNLIPTLHANQKTDFQK